jgi:hypothetical protein
MRLVIQVSCIAAAVFASWWIFGVAAPVVATPAAPSTANPSLPDVRAAAERSEVGRLLAALDAVRPTSAEARLLSTPDVNDWERKLKLGTVASLHTSEIDGGDRLGGIYVARMKSDPAAAIAAIESLLPKLPLDSFPIDRASLLDVAADLPGQQERARALAMSELDASCAVRRSLGLPTQDDPVDIEATSGDASELPCIVAQAVLVRLSSNADDALQMTLGAITRQSDEGIRATFVVQLLRVYPELLPRLQVDPRTRDLSLEIPESET